MTTKTPNTLTKQPWAVYCGFFPIGIGLVVEERENTVDILYTENQQYPAECWDSKAVRRFDTYHQAIDWYVERSDDSRDRLVKLIQRDFPNAISSQSSPSCTETPKIRLLSLDPPDRRESFDN